MNKIFLSILICVFSNAIIAGKCERELEKISPQVKEFIENKVKSDLDLTNYIENNTPSLNIAELEVLFLTYKSSGSYGIHLRNLVARNPDKLDEEDFYLLLTNMYKISNNYGLYTSHASYPITGFLESRKYQVSAEYAYKYFKIIYWRALDFGSPMWLYFMRNGQKISNADALKIFNIHKKYPNTWQADYYRQATRYRTNAFEAFVKHKKEKPFTLKEIQDFMQSFNGTTVHSVYTPSDILYTMLSTWEDSINDKHWNHLRKLVPEYNQRNKLKEIFARH